MLLPRRTTAASLLSASLCHSTCAVMRACSDRFSACIVRAVRHKTHHSSGGRGLARDDGRCTPLNECCSASHRETADGAVRSGAGCGRMRLLSSNRCVSVIDGAACKCEMSAASTICACKVRPATDSATRDEKAAEDIRWTSPIDTVRTRLAGEGCACWVGTGRGADTGAETAVDTLAAVAADDPSPPVVVSGAAAGAAPAAAAALAALYCDTVLLSLLSTASLLQHCQQTIRLVTQKAPHLQRSSTLRASPTRAATRAAVSSMALASITALGNSDRRADTMSCSCVFVYAANCSTRGIVGKSAVAVRSSALAMLINTRRERGTKSHPPT